MRGLILPVALALLGCKREPAACSASFPVLLELRDGAGALELALRGAPKAALGAEERGTASDVCDPSGRRVYGLLEAAAPPRTRTRSELTNAAGDLRARVEPSSGDALWTMPALAAPTLPDGGALPGGLRLHDEGGLLRLLDSMGVPVAQIGWQAGKAVAFDAGGMPLAWAETVEQRIVVRARDGAVKHYVIGIKDERAAAAIALEMFPLPERLLLARYLDRR
ncbi:MAG: hypothetical protein EXR72_20725 [Myxococcales bacterium]|nr:hypothetical protein [Myxococcales bacterium]